MYPCSPNCSKLRQERLFKVILSQTARHPTPKKWIKKLLGTSLVSAHLWSGSAQPSFRTSNSLVCLPPVLRVKKGFPLWLPSDLAVGLFYLTILVVLFLVNGLKNPPWSYRDLPILWPGNHRLWHSWPLCVLSRLALHACWWQVSKSFI